MRPDQKPARRPPFEEREAAFPIPVASELLLGIFGQQTGREYNIKVDELVNKHLLYNTFEGAWSRNPPTTYIQKTNSPRITPENVEGASQIVTVTYGHHNLGWGPDQDIVVALMENNDLKVYWFPKHQNEVRSGAFDLLSSWGPVHGLLREMTKRYESGVQISLWERNRFGKCYNMVENGQYTVIGLRLLELLEFLRQK